MGAAAPHPSLTERGQLHEAMLRALRRADQGGARDVVERAAGLGWTVEDVRLHLITPVLYDIGLLWQRGQIGVADEHLASSICEWLLFVLAGRAGRSPPTGRRALVGCSDGELHSLGARMLAHGLAEHGWAVLYLGAATPPAAWSQIARARHPEVAVMTSTTPGVLDRVGPALEAIKAACPACRTVIGGQAYRAIADASVFGADLVSLEASGLVAQLE